MAETVQIDLTKLEDYDYYSKKLLWIQAGEGLIRFNYEGRFVQKEINRLWEIERAAKRPVLFIVLKARRHGVSTYVQSRMFQGCHLKPHRQGITIGADEEGCSYIHNMSHVFYEFLPDQLRPITKLKSSKRLSFDIPKSTLMKMKGRVRGLKSSMKVVPSHERAGLSTGCHYIHMSEYSHYRDADAVRKAVIPTAFSVPDSFVVIESTANGMVGRGEAFYNEWRKAVDGKSVFKPMFFSWLQHEDYTRAFTCEEEKDEIRDTLTDDERELLEVHNATYEQINWRRYQIMFLGGAMENEEDLLSDIEAFHEQYPTTPEEAFIVSGNPIFSREKLREYKRSVKGPLWKGEIDVKRVFHDSSGHLKVWEDPIAGAKYVVSIDACSGEPGATDFGCIQVLRVMNLLKEGLIAVQAAEWHGKVGAEYLGQIAVHLSHRYNEALFAPEVFGYGHAVLSEAQRMDYWNIFKRQTFDVVERISKSKLGWKTDVSTKPALLSYGRHCVNNGLVIINSDLLVNEMMIYVREESHFSASAYGSGKDDRVDAFLIGLKVIDLEYNMSDVDSMGVQDPKEEKKKVLDKLQQDDFDPSRKKKSNHWLDY